MKMVSDGEEVYIGPGEDFIVACCDCGLTHTHRYQHTDGGGTVVTILNEPAITDKERKRGGYPLAPRRVT